MYNYNTDGFDVIEAIHKHLAQTFPAAIVTCIDQLNITIKIGQHTWSVAYYPIRQLLESYGPKPRWCGSGYHREQHKLTSQVITAPDCLENLVFRLKFEMLNFTSHAARRN